MIAPNAPMLVRRDVTVPAAQVVPVRLVFASDMPLGKSSLNVAPVSAVALLFVNVNVIVVAPPTPMILDMANAFENVGATNTSRFAAAVSPLPALVVETAPVELERVPVTALVTSIETVQLPPAAILPPVSASDVPLGNPVTVPPQVLTIPGATALNSCAGYVSVNATPEIACDALVLVNAIVSVEIPPAAILIGEKDLTTVGGPIMVMVAIAALLVPAFVVVTLPVEFAYVAAVAEVTPTVTTHVELVGMVAPGILIPVSLATTAVLPRLVMAAARIVQLVAVTFGIAATLRPTGNVSVTFTPVIESEFRFWRLIVSVAVWLGSKTVGDIALVTTGGERTMMRATLLGTPGTASSAWVKPLVWLS